MPNTYIELIDSLILRRRALKISQRELASTAGVSWTEFAPSKTEMQRPFYVRLFIRIHLADFS